MMRSLSLLAVSFVLAAVSAADTCNPLNTQCPPNVGLPRDSYSIDFTQQTAIPSDWTISNWATVKFGAKGAEFTVSKRFESPQLWTNFYVFYGRVEIVAQVAPGTGIVSSAVLMSDDADEIDWEFSGNNFGVKDSAGLGQNNYYGKGIVGSYDRGSFSDVASPQTQFHTYTIDWTAESLTWLVDGKTVRTLYAANADSDTHQYPQTPSKFQLGIWAGGDPGNAWGTVNWAGGYTDFTKAPFTMYVKSVKIQKYNPAYAYNWTDKSGSSKSIKLIREPPLSSSTSKASTSSFGGTPTSSSTTTAQSSTSVKVPATCSAVPATAPIQDGIVSGCTKWHTAVSGDTCSKIATKYGIPIDTFMQWNSAVDPPLCWNMWLNYGYCVSIDCAGASTASPVISTTSSSRSTSISSVITPSTTIAVSSTPLPTTTISPTSTSSIPSSSSAVPSTGSGSTPSSPTGSSASTNSFCPDVDGQSLKNGDGSTYTVKCTSDSTQGAYSNTQAVDSFFDCMKACDVAASEGCTAWTYVGGTGGKGSGTCWLKQGSGTFTTAGGNFVSGSLVAKGSSSSSISQPISSSSGTSQSASSTSNSSKTQTATTTDEVKTSSTTYASAPTELCPQADSQSLVASKKGAIYFIRCSADTNIGSYTNTRAPESSADCIDACDASPGCLAFTYVGGNGGKGTGTCWLKDLKGSAVPAGPNFIAGFLATKGPSMDPSASVVPSSTAVVSSSSLPTTTVSPTSASSTSTTSTAWATNSAGSNYTIYRSSDTNWGAYGNTAATTSYSDCITTCDNDSKCKAFTYVGGKEGKGPGTCWLKSQLGLPVPAGENFISGSRVDKATKVRRALSSWWNRVSEATARPTDTRARVTATSKPSAPSLPKWAKYYPHGGRWLWNGRGNWEWGWN